MEWLKYSVLWPLNVAILFHLCLIWAFCTAKIWEFYAEKSQKEWGNDIEEEGLIGIHKSPRTASDKDDEALI